MANVPVDATAFAVFDMQELSADSFDAGLAEAGDDLAAVFVRRLAASTARSPGKPCWRSRTRSARSVSGGFTAISTSVGRFVLHGVPTWFFFSCGKRLGRATGWHGLGHCQAAVAAAWEKIGKLRVVGLKKADSVDSGKSSTD
jgi:hypothetical protein